MAATGSQSTFSKTGTMALQNEGPTMEKNIQSATQHWQSVYRAVTSETTSRPRIISNRPTWSLNRIGYSSSRGTYKTEFTENIGTYGHNPRNLLPRDAEKQ
jgi:hypothetical protein